ncbi:hypothetical protein CALVIDRAFT_483385 [Calocera viscosa TUFC12733]|uniref:P-loop containing nucleoside triphosphate hydrolase protein n=1 Tax=Calocera viscosa (strain TUFC12733) TaxID=1330018 RepID=A0A167KUH1_CALVF|nr:hypothetical protein CALVIDRAFT_483385 [Calocera viscosa TUFC12733]
MGDSQPTPGQSNADISNSLYALHTQQLFDIIDQIRDIGGKLDLDLPRIVVIGNQSAGKSSLIEAIARITVPRGAGTCTRCPTEVRLRSSTEPWKCAISLRYEYDDAGNETGGSILVSFGEDIHDPSQVEIMLRRAQIAVLNDEYNPRIYLDVDPAQMEVPDTQRQFSKNVVCIEVSGPLLTDLTFVDLPGIIQHHPTDPDLVDLIKSMVREYISDPSALILCTITMKDDPENQAALREAKAADPEGKRTIGVLTKPDTLQSEEEALWISVLNNEGRHRLNLGYYITKQPTQAEVQQGISFDTARKNEVCFFETVEIWRDLPIDVQQNVGTPRLTSALSQLLSAQIRNSHVDPHVALLPGIFDEIHERLDQVNETIASLGAGPSANPVADTIGLCDQFTRALNRYTTGTDGFERLVQHNNRAFSAFKTAIRGTAPLFLPYTKQELQWNHDYLEPTSIIEDRADGENGKTYNLEAVKQNIKDATTRELPFNVPYTAKVRMMLLPIRRWEDLVNTCFGTVHPNVGSIIEHIIQDVFGKFDQSPLLRLVKDIAEQQLAARVAETQQSLKLLFGIEMQGPYTQNSHYISATREKLIVHYRDTRRQRVRRAPSPPPPPSPPSPWVSRGGVYVDQRVPMPQPMPIPSSPPPRYAIIRDVISNLASLGFHGVTASDFPRLVVQDEWEEEIVVMAETRAYFQVAYKRIIDTIPQAIDFVFVRPLADIIHRALISGLQFDSPDAHERCKAYLAESPQKAAQRQRLNADRERLERAREALRAIGFGH